MTPSVRALAALAAGAALAVALGCQSAPSEPAPAAGVTPSPGVRVTAADATAAGIETAAAHFVERSNPIAAAGVVTFDERRTARIGSLVEGVVDEMRVQPGDVVARGAVVARLHSHVVHDAWADYFKGLAEHRRLDAELAFSRSAEASAAALVADKALSPQELARARADVTAAVQRVAAARAEITRTEQELHHFGITPRPDADPLKEEDAPVVTPFGGTVIERHVTEGAAVTPGTPLLVVSDLSHVWVMAEIDETLVGRVAAGQPVAIATAAYPGETFPGTLTSIGAVVNAASRRVTLRVEAANPGQRLKPQMFVTVSIAATATRRVLVVPSGAVQTMDGESVVFVRTGADQFSRRAVTTGAGGRRAGGDRRWAGRRRRRGDLRGVPAQVGAGRPGRGVRVGGRHRAARPGHVRAAGLRSAVPGGARGHRRAGRARPAGRGVPGSHEQPGSGDHRRAEPGRARGRATRLLSDRDGAHGRAEHRRRCARSRNSACRSSRWCSTTRCRSTSPVNS